MPIVSIDDVPEDFYADPKTLVTKYYPLEGAVGPLKELARENPAMLEHIITLAMCMGIAAAQRKFAADTLRYEEPIAPGSRVTYGDLMRLER